MGTQYSGLASNVTLPTGLSISSSTNANPIVVTTAAAHNLTTGDTVDIVGHQVNTNANGVNAVTVLSGNTFSIPVAGNGVGGATGTVNPITFGSTFTIPSDGDLISASNNNVPLEANGDRSVALLLRTGQYKLAAYISAPLSDPNWYTTPTTQWLIPRGIHLALSTTKIATVSGLLSGDLLDVSMSGTAKMPDVGTGQVIGGISLAAVYYAPGVAPGVVTHIAGSSQLWNVPTGALSVLLLPFTLTGYTPATVNGNMDLYFMGVGNNSVVDVFVYLESMLTVRVWRATGVLQ